MFSLCRRRSRGGWTSNNNIKVKSSPSGVSILPQNVGSVINDFQLCTEAYQWETPSCSQPQPATDNGVRDGRSN